MTRCKWKKWLYLVHFAYPKLDFGGHLEFRYFPELGFLGTFNMLFRTVFWVVPEKLSVLRIYSTWKPNVPGLKYVKWRPCWILYNIAQTINNKNQKCLFWPPDSYKINKLSNFEPHIRKTGLNYFLIAICFLFIWRSISPPFWFFSFKFTRQ